MDETTLQDERTIEAHIDELRAQLDRAAEDLRAKDESLAQRAAERKRFSLLGEACVALEELSALGASDAFWGELSSANEGDAHVQRLRARVRAFEHEILAIEEQRAQIAAGIAQTEENLWLLEDDLLELREQEEQRKLDWVIEREASTPAAHETIMPWSRHREEAARLRRSLAVALATSLVFGLLLPWIELPVPDLEPIELPDRLTRLIAEARPVSVAWKSPETLAPPEPRERTPEPVENVPVVAESTEAIPEESSPAKGLLAFRENLSARAEPAVGGRLGSRARISRAGEAAVGQSRRSLVSSNAAQSSGGIDVGTLDRTAGNGGGGTEMSGVDIARAQSAIGGGGTSDRPVAGGGPPAGRTDEEIQIVFDRHKSALYRLYNRELRQDPSLRGQMVLRLVIQPDGSVSLCELRSTDMRAPNLAEQVVARVKTFDFGAKDVPAVTILYPIDFLPAT